VAAPLPIIKAPMAATQVQRPFDHPGWIYEKKVDGWRVLAYIPGGRTGFLQARQAT